LWQSFSQRLAQTLRAHQSAEFGARAILVHAIDDEAAAFHTHFGFEPSPLEPNQLMLLMKDLRASLKSLGFNSGP
jgi:hypothetical protein